MASNPPDVFVSYNRNDRRWAEWIAWVLEDAGYRVVIQAWDFRPGSNFVLEMDAATEAQHTVAVLSASYLAAEYTQPEWAAAFAEDPKGTERRLIPMRVEDCKPKGLLKQVTWVDLVGLGEPEAKRAVVSAFAERAKPSSAPSFPGGRGTATAKVLFPRDFKPEIALAKLPSTGDHFVARDAELGRLDAAWANPETSLVILVAAGGVGKSALVNRWLDRLRKDGWRGAERVLGGRSTARAAPTSPKPTTSPHATPRDRRPPRRDPPRPRRRRPRRRPRPPRLGPRPRRHHRLRATPA